MDKSLKGKKIGLALGGGGARGIAHIGVIKALETAGIPIHAIAGTSMGALVGGWYAVHGEISSLERIFLNIKKEDMVSSLKMYWRRDGTLFKDKDVTEMVERKMKGKHFKDCLIPFAAVATDVKSGEEVIIKEGSVSEAIHASSAIPFIFKPVSMDGRLLMDGGFVNPIPADVVRKMGVDFVIAVDVTRGWVDITEGSSGLMDIPRTIDRLMTAIEYQIGRKQLEGTDMVLHPDVMSFSWLDFFRSKEIISAGAEEVIRNLGEIDKKTSYPPIPKSIFAKFMDFIFRN
jgi:NTE family protein